MPGYVLHLNAVVNCAHGGPAIPTAPVPRVLVSGQPITTIASPYGVAGCPFTGTGGPCVSAQWTVAAVRVASFGQPVVIHPGVSVCAPNGAVLVPTAMQTRVIAM